MGTCPACKFDGSQDLPEGLHFPDGYAAEKRVVYKTITDRGQTRSIIDKDETGRPKFTVRHRCPACGHTDDKENISSKPKKAKEVDE